MRSKLLLLLSTVALALFSCSKDYDILPSAESIILTADSSTKIIGNEIVFTVKTNDGNDLTNEAVIYVDGAVIEGHTYTSETVGTYEVKAEYAGVESAPVTITFHDGSEINFAKNVLIEDYTGTWCGYCPRVAFGIEQVKLQTDNVVAVAIHRASLNPNDPSYDPYTFDSTVLEDLINIPGYPKGMLNRMTQWSFPEDTNVSQPIALTQGENPKLGLAMTSSVSNGTINLDVNVQFSKDFTGLKLVVYVLENGLVHEQHNYTQHYNDQDVIPDFVHNHVLRSCLTPLLGEPVSGSETVTGNIYTKSFTVPVPSTVENANNLEFVAFIVDSDNKAVNVRNSEPGETQDFQEL